MGEFLNRVTLIGRLGQEPEIRRTLADKRMLVLSVATSEIWGKGEERHEQTVWHRVISFAEPIVEYAEAHLSKGCWVFVEGKLQINEWEDKDGLKRQTPQIALDPYNGILRLLESRTPRRPDGAAAVQRKPMRRHVASGDRDPVPA